MSAVLSRARRLILGPARDFTSPETRRHIALAAFFAWVGLGADGLSSANYGPEEAFLALGEHAHLGLYLAMATAVTVFVIALGYNQVIALFPTGGGGYKVASKLLGAHVGLVSGSALVIDYVLTITISIASGTDALFSLLPLEAQAWKLGVEVALILALLVMNLRGVKESIAVLMPIFLCFVLSHGLLIVYGVAAHGAALPTLVPDVVAETRSFADQAGWGAVIAALLMAYSLGAGTYTGIEAVSNNIDRLAEPRVRTGRVTMVYMAASLAFTAAGIIVLYIVWDVRPEEGRTLNAVAFASIMKGWAVAGVPVDGAILTVVLCSAAGLLFVAANTGFLGGPAVLANMALDRWLPHQFTALSQRLVTENGIVLMGAAALAVLLWTGGDVRLLVVLYSINVFITFTLSLLGMSVYWWRHRPEGWIASMALSGAGFLLCAAILGVTMAEKLGHGGWATLLVTSLLVALCLMIRRHYLAVDRRLAQLDGELARPIEIPPGPPPALDPSKPTAAFLVGGSLGTGMHALLWVARLFPGQFRNLVFINVGEVDSQSFGGAEALESLKARVGERLGYYVRYCHRHGLAARSYESYGTDHVDQLQRIVDRVAADFPNVVFFCTKLVFARDSLWTRILHNQTALALQRRLHRAGRQMFILPMNL